jgi:hypothetical protein
MIVARPSHAIRSSFTQVAAVVVVVVVVVAVAVAVAAAAAVVCPLIKCEITGRDPVSDILRPLSLPKPLQLNKLGL